MKITCALCKNEKENKKNTHYLTDKIIRSCLNQDGCNEREKGLYYDISNTSPEIEFGFQRNTSIERVQQTLGRDTTDKEINNAKKNPFSVDTVFCKECEDIFTSIESKFITNILPLFREQNLNDKEELTHKDSKIIRLFFLLQIWRTSVCESTFVLSDTIKENLRNLILASFNASDKELKQYPLSVTYLQTLGGSNEFTRNAVGPTCDGKQPHIIFMNDFIIQFYEKESDIRFDNFYGLNSRNTFRKYININEDEFRFQILSDAKRKSFLINKDSGKRQKVIESELLERWKWIGRIKWSFLK